MNAKSDSYQHIFKEISVDVIRDDMVDHEVDPDYSDEYKDLNDLAIKRVMKIARNKLTDHQEKIFQMVKEGNTQQEIADEMGLSQQSSIGKVLLGNPKNSMSGIYVKLRKFLKTDVKFRNIIRDMYEMAHE